MSPNVPTQRIEMNGEYSPSAPGGAPTAPPSSEPSSTLQLQYPYEKFLYLVEMFAELPVECISSVVEENQSASLQTLIDKCLNINQTPFDTHMSDAASHVHANASNQRDVIHIDDNEDPDDTGMSNTISWLPPSTTGTSNSNSSNATQQQHLYPSTSPTNSISPSSATLNSAASPINYSHLKPPNFMNLGSDLHTTQSNLYNAMREFHEYMMIATAGSSTSPSLSSSSQSTDHAIEQYIVCIRTFERIIQNVVNDPQNDKFRLLNLNNPKLHNKVVIVAGALNVLRGCKFHDVKEYDEVSQQENTSYLLLDADNIDINLLRYGLELIQSQLSVALKIQKGTSAKSVDSSRDKQATSSSSSSSSSATSASTSTPPTRSTNLSVDEDSLYKPKPKDFSRVNKSRMTLADIRAGQQNRSALPTAIPLNYTPHRQHHHPSKDEIAKKFEAKLGKQQDPTKTPSSMSTSSTHPTSRSPSPSPSTAQRSSNYSYNNNDLTQPLLSLPSYNDALTHPPSSSSASPRPPSAHNSTSPAWFTQSSDYQPSNATINAAAQRGEVVQGRVTDFSSVKRMKDAISSVRRDKHTQHATREGVKRHYTLQDLDEMRKEEFKAQAKWGSGAGQNVHQDSSSSKDSKFVDVSKYGMTREDLLHIGHESLRYTNEFRMSQGLPPLEWHQSIWEVSMVHSRDMAEGRVPFGHQGFHERVQAFPFAHSGAAENVAWNGGIPYTSVARVAVDGWINSPGHRKNMLGTYSHCAIAVYRNASGQYYLTQMFALCT